MAYYIFPNLMKLESYTAWLPVYVGPLLARLQEGVNPSVTFENLQSLIQIPIVAAFIWFSLKLVSVFLDHVTKQGDKFLAAQQEQTRLFASAVERLSEIQAKAQAENTADMKAFLAVFQTNYIDGMARLAEEQKRLIASIAVNSEVITRHDAMNHELLDTLIRNALELSEQAEQFEQEQLEPTANLPASANNKTKHRKE